MKNFKRFHSKYGEGKNNEVVSQDIINHYINKIPPEIIFDWKESGWCSYHNGFFWTVNPNSYKEILSDWINPSNDAFVFLRTAFGSMFIWNGEEVKYIDVLFKEITNVPRRMDVLFDGLFCDEDYLNDIMQLNIYYEALPKLGEPQSNECYGFFPPLTMGGYQQADTLKKVDLEVHLHLLSQI